MRDHPQQEGWFCWAFAVLSRFVPRWLSTSPHGVLIGAPTLSCAAAMWMEIALSRCVSLLSALSRGLLPRYPHAMLLLYRCLTPVISTSIWFPTPPARP